MSADPKEFGNVIAGKFGGKYSPQALLAVMAQDPAVDGFVGVISRRDPKDPYQFVLVNVEEAEQLAFMRWMCSENIDKILNTGLGEVEPPKTAA